jgi:hypothetical protein
LLADGDLEGAAAWRAMFVVPLRSYRAVDIAVLPRGLSPSNGLIELYGVERLPDMKRYTARMRNIGTCGVRNEPDRE